MPPPHWNTHDQTPISALPSGRRQPGCLREGRDGRCFSRVPHGARAPVARDGPRTRRPAAAATVSGGRDRRRACPALIGAAREGRGGGERGALRCDRREGPSASLCPSARRAARPRRTRRLSGPERHEGQSAQGARPRRPARRRPRGRAVLRFRSRREGCPGPRSVPATPRAAKAEAANAVPMVRECRGAARGPRPSYDAPARRGTEAANRAHGPSAVKGRMRGRPAASRGGERGQYAGPRVAATGRRRPRTTAARRVRAEALVQPPAPAVLGDPHRPGPARPGRNPAMDVSGRRGPVALAAQPSQPGRARPLRGGRSRL